MSIKPPISRRPMSKEESIHLTIELAVSAYSDAEFVNDDDKSYNLLALNLLHNMIFSCSIVECKSCSQYL